MLVLSQIITPVYHFRIGIFGSFLCQYAFHFVARLWSVSKTAINTGMKTAIVQAKHPVTLVGGGQIASCDLDLAMAVAPTIVAADGGADAVLAHGHMPDAVIGDMDSISTSARTSIPQDRQHRLDEQDSTDFDKALRNIKAPLILAVGFLGGRLDHQLAVLNTLTTRHDRPCILIGTDEIVLHAPARLVVDLAPGDVVSLFPMAPVTGRSSGLRWPIEGLDLSPSGRIGTSNEALGRVTLETDGPGLLLIVPKRALQAVTRALGSGQPPVLS